MSSTRRLLFQFLRRLGKCELLYIAIVPTYTPHLISCSGRGGKQDNGYNKSTTVYAPGIILIIIISCFNRHPYAIRCLLLNEKPFSAAVLLDINLYYTRAHILCLTLEFAAIKKSYNNADERGDFAAILPSHWVILRG